MKFNKLSLITIFIILFNHFTTAQMFSFQTSNGPEYQQQFEKYMSWQQEIILRNTGFFTVIIATIIACNYLPNSNTDSNLEMEYPYAEQWYQAMDTKYPQAFLQTKQFKKSKFSESASVNIIQFMSSSLQEINTIYKKQLENKELTEQEFSTIKKYEFLLLSQAGYIENNSSIKGSAAFLTSYAISNSLIVPFLKLYHPIGGDVFDINSFQRGIDQFKFDYNMLSIIQILGILVTSGSLNIYYENIGDTFAATICDDESLKATIQAFKYEENSKYRAKKLQEEFTKRQLQNT
ncbi:hypothetical protein KBC04_03120 [Candidatus Babeliales bacterium]|nr:hypothetical protein [Candidatus Babeliales bacterium]MBP9843958.1 hypothetical protein [Candidatus Babeliales bacterium]